MISQWGCKAGFTNQRFTRVYYLLQKYKNPSGIAKKLADAGPKQPPKTTGLSTSCGCCLIGLSKDIYYGRIIFAVWVVETVGANSNVKGFG